MFDLAKQLLKGTILDKVNSIRELEKDITKKLQVVDELKAQCIEIENAIKVLANNDQSKVDS